MLYRTKLPNKGQKNKPHLYVCWLSRGRMQRKQLIWRKINIWKQYRLPGSLAAIFSIICWNVTWFLKCCFLPYKYAITTKWVWKGTNQMKHINSDKKVLGSLIPARDLPPYPSLAKLMSIPIVIAKIIIWFICFSIKHFLCVKVKFKWNLNYYLVDWLFSRSELI